jgi:hypothetical protein
MKDTGKPTPAFVKVGSQGLPAHRDLHGAPEEIRLEILDEMKMEIKQMAGATRPSFGWRYPPFWPVS